MLVMESSIFCDIADKMALNSIPRDRILLTRNFPHFALLSTQLFQHQYLACVLINVIQELVVVEFCNLKTRLKPVSYPSTL